MKRFIFDVLKFIIPPFLLLLILVVTYILCDPFKVIYHYDDYSHSYVIPNRDFISTSMYINNRDKYHYDSFIFGSSRAIAYKPSSWKKYLGPHDQPFSFDASAESIYGIWKKVKYLNETGAEIDNALIIICRDVTFETDKDQEGHLFIKHPAVSKNSRIVFHFTFFKAYCNPMFLYSYIRYNLTKQYSATMEGYLDNRVIEFDRISNEVSIINLEHEITRSSEEYYRKRKDLFYAQKGETVDTVDRIKPSHIKMMEEIVEIFKRHHTKYKVIISPLYDQVKFSVNDKAILKRIFKDSLYDFSGSNSYTNDRTNYYETSHYRPSVGDSILSIIYRE